MKESKTVQVYPSDNIVNATIEEQGSFGWEVINNQRCQEYDRQTRDTDGSLTNHYSTFNKITFTREKSSPWYDEVTQLENEHEALENTKKRYRDKKPTCYPPNHAEGMDYVFCVLLYFLFLLPGIIFTIVICVKGSKYKKYMKQYDVRVAEYNRVYLPKIKEVESQQAELRARAEKCISGK